MKTEGNNLMRTEKFQEALDMYSKVIMIEIMIMIMIEIMIMIMYSKAIELDGSNPVFYCNRAAAHRYEDMMMMAMMMIMMTHSKMTSHHLAIEDCQRAIDMDPSYSKAGLDVLHTKC